VLLTLQRRANSGGHFAPDRFSERGGAVPARSQS
jgi:hypothetical protein